MNVARANHANPAAATRRPEPKTAPTPEVTTAPAPESTPTDGGGQGKAKLIEKLASGHFNDVAAIRLRLNHADAIAAAGVTLEAPPETTDRAQGGYAKALAAYTATLPPAPDEPVVDEPTGEAPVVDPVVDEPVADEPVVDTTPTGVTVDTEIVPDLEVLAPAEPEEPSVIDELLEELTEPGTAPEGDAEVPA